MVVVPFHPGKDDVMWDAFVEETSTSTLLHTRRFLSYHGDRFRDCSKIVRDDRGRVMALFPAAQSMHDPRVVVSHPGATYGGLLCSERCRGEELIQALRLLAEDYLQQGYTRMIYKAVPYIYHHRPFQDDLYALFRLGAKRIRCDLSACIDLAHRGRVSSRRKRGCRKAEKAGVRIVEGGEHALALWDVLKENLQRKYGVSPVHSLEEILLLHERFPEEIRFVTAQLDQNVIAGVVLFESRMVSHAQYIASSQEGYQVSALDKVFEHCIEQARNRGRRYFDFGICNEQDGRVLNTGLYRFKSEFGAGGVVHEFYEVDLEGLDAVG